MRRSIIAIIRLEFPLPLFGFRERLWKVSGVDFRLTKKAQAADRAIECVNAEYFLDFFCWNFSSYVAIFIDFRPSRFNFSHLFMP